MKLRKNTNSTQRHPSQYQSTRAEPLEKRTLLSASLWVDANTTPSTVVGSLATAPYVMGAQAFFTVNDGAHGKELWRTDGTEAGTRLVLDINPGTLSSVPSTGPRMCAVNGKLFFVADDGIHGDELWVSDGTSAGTHLVSDLNVGAGGANAFHLTAFGDYLYFYGTNGAGFSLFRANENGASLFQEMHNFSLASNNTPFTVVDNTMYYNGLSSMAGLWATDGTSAGTRRLLTSGAGALAPLNGRLFFYYTTAAAGAEPWISDGTASGTFQIADLNPGTASSTPSNPVTFDGKTYFFATDAAHGKALWSTGGTAANTSIALDLKGSLGLTSPTDVVTTSSRLAFSAVGTDGKRRLYVSDGSIDGTIAVSDASGSFLPPQAGLISASHDAVYFLSGTFDTPTGVYRVGNAESLATYLPTGLTGEEFVVPFGVGVLTRGEDADAGKELWFANPISASSSRLVDGYPGTAASAAGAFVRAGNRLYFYANRTSGNLAELWASDLDGTHPHRVASSVPYSSLGAQLVPVGNADSVAFLATTDQGRQLWVSDGTTAGTHALSVAIGEDYTMGANPNPRIMSVGGRVYFSGSDSTHGRELWMSDGTDAGTGMVADLNPGTGDSIVALMNVVGSTLFFADSIGNGAHLYRTQGTAASTTLLLPAQLIQTLDAQSAVLNEKLYFDALEPNTYISHLYSSDGTVAGTELVRPANPLMPYTDASDPVATSDRVYFRAASTTQGHELWQVGPTGASPVADINPGIAESSPDLLGAVGNRVLFTATDGTHGKQVWTSDGTASETRVLYPFTAPTPDSLIRFLGTNKGRAFFFGNEAATGSELWQTDGTPAGTTIVRDVVTGTGSSSVFASSFAAYDDRVIFTLTDGYRGIEPWITDDERAPIITGATYDNSVAPTVKVIFDEAMTTVADLSKIAVVSVVTGQVFNPTAAQFDATGRRATLTLPKKLPDGNFTVQIVGDAFKDQAGHPAALGASIQFLNLPGDANGDRTVNFADLVILAQNYGQTSRTFAQGNFDYSDDGKVDFTDLVLLAQHYNVSITPALIAPSALVSSRNTTATRRSDIDGICK